MKNWKQQLASVPMAPPSNYARDKGVYLHRRGTDRVPMYVGIGVEGRPEKVDGRNADWTTVYEAHGRTVEMLHTNLTEWQAKTIEVALIFKYRNVYGRYLEGGSMVNLSDGGEGSSGYKFTEEQLENLRVANSRPEVKAKRSAVMKMANSRPEVKAKQSAAAKIAANRPETKAKKSAASTGELNPSFGKFGEQHNRFQGYSVGVNEEQFVILSGSKVMKECGFNQGSISSCISGNRPSHKGFTWTRSSTLNPSDFLGLKPFNSLTVEHLARQFTERARSIGRFDFVVP
jgi:hypothetical protein